MNKYIVEFIGTFFLVFVVGLAAVHGGAGTLAPLAIGGILMCMIFAGGHISGGHFNPAVTIAVWWRGKCSLADMPMYWAAQFAGGILAAVIVMAIKGVGSPPFQPDLMPVLTVEFLCTFALAYVVLHTATAKDNEKNSFYGLAIGFTVASCAFAVGPISLGVFNPAVAAGLLVLEKLDVAGIWIYLAAQIAAGLVAAIAFKIVSPEDR